MNLNLIQLMKPDTEFILSLFFLIDAMGLCIFYLCQEILWNYMIFDFRNIVKWVYSITKSIQIQEIIKI
jgi:hypothetical protein